MKYFILSNHGGERELTKKQARFYLKREYGEEKADEILKEEKEFSIVKVTYDVYTRK